MHRDTCTLGPVWVHHPRELEPRHARMVPHLPVLHPGHPGRPLVVACEALEVEDLDDSARGGGGHHKQVCEPVVVNVEEEGHPCGKGEMSGGGEQLGRYKVELSAWSVGRTLEGSDPCGVVLIIQTPMGGLRGGIGYNVVFVRDLSALRFECSCTIQRVCSGAQVFSQATSSNRVSPRIR
jgi:hypothetical protein